uniref:Uncharacterized protein n=1 Tax=Rhabditophanes sp. KR3021 TaxID=114890 RepID=A0AC35UBK1_9BILA
MIVEVRDVPVITSSKSKKLVSEVDKKVPKNAVSLRKGGLRRNETAKVRNKVRDVPVITSSKSKKLVNEVDKKVPKNAASLRKGGLRRNETAKVRNSKKGIKNAFKNIFNAAAGQFIDKKIINDSSKARSKPAGKAVVDQTNAGFTVSPASKLEEENKDAEQLPTTLDPLPKFSPSLASKIILKNELEQPLTKATERDAFYDILMDFAQKMNNDNTKEGVIIFKM